MPRVQTLEKFMEYRLRHIASNKNATPSQQLRALFALSVMASRRAQGLHWAFDVQMKDQEGGPGGGERPESLGSTSLDNTIKAMLDRAKNGGASAKLSPSGTSGS